MKDYKKDFDFFNNTNNIYLDNAASSQKPHTVIDAQSNFYKKYNANIHRGLHSFSNRATLMYEDARKESAKFIGAKSEKSIIFTKGVTEGINLLASCLDAYETVLISSLEHHSNIVPWQLQNKNLKVIKCKDDLNIDYESYEKLLQDNPNSLVSVTHISNVFGIINDVKKLTVLAHKYSCLIHIDGAQAGAHIQINVEELDVDFYTLSAHKVYGPTGVGLFFGKFKYLQKMKPYQGGGAMISNVTYENSTFLDAPLKFEAGTQNLSGVIGWAEAIKYMDSHDWNELIQYEENIYNYAVKSLKKIENIEFYTNAKNLTSALSFNIKGLHHEDIGTLLDKQGISVRTGHHCAMPLMKMLGLDGTIRISFGIYNDEEDINRFITALKKSIEILKRHV